jgi:glycolate oxidase
VVEDPSLIPDVLFRVVDTEMAEDVGVFTGTIPKWLEGLHMVSIFVTGNSEEEIQFKLRTLKSVLKEYEENKTGGFSDQPRVMKHAMLQTPFRFTVKMADFLKGGGFEYSGPILPVGLYPQAFSGCLEVSARHGLPYSVMSRVVARGTAIMVGAGYVFNRADSEGTEKVKEALHDLNETFIGYGAIPYKAEQPVQELIMNKMDPATLDLMKRLKNLLDPNGIMNPGNWEVS